jgi:hypothetical protein
LGGSKEADGLKSLTIDIKRVARRTNRSDDIAGTWQVDRLAQAADMDIDCPQVDIFVHAPNRVEQLITRMNANGTLNEIAQ